MTSAAIEGQASVPHAMGYADPESGSSRRGKLPKSARKRTKILDSAAKIFARRGYAATLSEIAEEAGTQAGSLYYYFASRDHLVDEVIRISMATVSIRVREAIEDLPEDATWIEKIATGFRAHVRAHLENHHYGLAYLKIIDQVPREIQRRYLVLPKDYAIYWREIFQAAQAAGEIHTDLSPNLIRRLMFGSTNNALRWYDPRRAPNAEQIADNICQIFLYGLSANGLRMGAGGEVAEADRAPSRRHA